VRGRVRPAIWLRVALRAYPSRWRRAHQTELIDLLRDSVAPERTWPGWRVATDLVVGGWRIRWRMRPPFLRWLGYRFLDIRLPAPWQQWARDDIDGAWWPVRTVAVGVAIAAAIWLVIFALPVPSPYLVTPPLAVVFTSVFGARRQRRRARLTYDSPIPSADVGLWQGGWIPAPARLRVAPILAMAGAALVPGGLFAAWALLHPSSQPRLGHVVGSIWLALALGVAVLTFTVAVHRRTARLLATRRPDERPPRHLRSVVVAGMIAVQLSMEAAWGLAQRADLIPGIICLILTAGIAIGPALIVLALVALRSERQIGLDVTGRDLRLAIFGASDVIPPEPARHVIVVTRRNSRRSTA
jgi:hypothetical protein